MIDLSMRILMHNDKVAFNPMTRNYGRAEFIFCIPWKNRILDKIYITPMQQPDAKEAFLLQGLHQLFLSIDSWTYKGIELPKIWQHGWCSDHDCAFMRVYVPTNSNFFEVLCHSTDLIIVFDHDGSQNEHQ